MQVITGDSAQMTTLVEEVNAGSQQQTTGVAGIGKAIQQIQSVTQSNAAGAEKSAAAAEELNSQSRRLSDVVDRLNELVAGN